MGAVVSNIRARFRDGLHLLREDYLQIDDELELSITKTYLRMFFACMVFNIVGLITYEWGNEFMGYILMFSESSSRLIKWIIGLCVVPTCIAMSGMIAIGIGYSNTGFAMVFSAIIGYVLFAIVESLNWKKYCGYLRKMCSCRGAEIHTPEQPSPSQPLLQPPTLQVPVPEPPTLQVPVPEPPT
ncbi:unnamed protein product, partial [Larinioides sclopetarius]